MGLFPPVGRRSLHKVSATLVAAGLAIFLFSSVLIIFSVNRIQKQDALKEAEEKALLILDRNLAIHAYINRQVKPPLFLLTAPVRPPEFFDPRWMSSTYAVREIDRIAGKQAPLDYYYKESAVNARTAANEADEVERAFIGELNRDPSLQRRSQVRDIGGNPFFEVMIRGEVMEEGCLGCHSEPSKAPGNLVAVYGSQRSFHRKAGEVLDAISIRIPLANAYARANLVAARLSLLLLAITALSLLAFHHLNGRLLLRPLSDIRDRMLAVAGKEKPIGETIPLPPGRELAEVADAFNSMSTALGAAMTGLEEKVLERTSALEKSNAELAKAHSFRVAIEESIAVGIVLISPDRRIRYANPAFCRMTGLAPVELIDAAPPFPYWPPEDAAVNRAAFDRLLAGGAGAPFIELRYMRKNGERFYALVQNSRLFAGETEEGWISVFVETTELRKAQEELARSRNLESVGLLAGGMSHDINNLLTAVMGNLSLARMLADSPDRAREKLQDAEKVSLQIRDLVARLMGLARGSALERARCAMGRLLEAAAQGAGLPARITLSWRIDPALWPVEANTRLLRQAFINLFVNSADAMPEGGELFIAAANHVQDGTRPETAPVAPGRYVRVELRDRGRGIPPGDLERIFDPYFTTKKTPAIRGVGLGLPAANSIVRQHGGFITVDSRVGEGTTVVVFLPAAPGAGA
jgi:PAS domain S-box-containing protein